MAGRGSFWGSLPLVLASAVVGGCIVWTTQVIASVDDDDDEKRIRLRTDKSNNKKNSGKSGRQLIHSLHESMLHLREALIRHVDGASETYGSLLYRLVIHVSDNLAQNFPLWVGSYWLLYKQQQQPASSTQKQNNNNTDWTPMIIDSLVLGLLLLSSSSNPATLSSRNTNDEKKVSAHKKELGQDDSSFLQTIFKKSNEPVKNGKDEKEVKPKERYVELLVHNVSHTDLVLSLDASRGAVTTLPDDDGDSPASESSPNKKSTDESDYCLCRPRFSAFDNYSLRVRNSLPKKSHLLSESLIRIPRYERNEATPRYNIKPEPEGAALFPVGVSLERSSCNDLVVAPEELSDLRVRGRDAPRIVSTEATRINAIFFPLLSTLLPRWHARISEKYSPRDNLKKVLILVTGVGTPRNWTHSVTGNSTEKLADLMEEFINTLHPDITVVKIHSDTNIFRYDENILFVQRELVPCINSWRDSHAKGLPYPDETEEGSFIRRFSSSSSSSYAAEILEAPFNTEWRKSFSVTQSFADGSPARNHAIQAALRTYRPSYFHFWQLKTFWHESKMVDSDIEEHSFEEMETMPAIETNMLTNHLSKMVVNEMKAFREEMDRILAGGGGSNDIKSFWLRKTHKPVLAVLAVQMPGDKKPRLYRGTNMEVSMPTGSLCAERNVIGSALAENPSLKREHLKMIAVLAVNLEEHHQALPKSSSTSSIVDQVPITELDQKRMPLVGSSRSTASDDGWVLEAPKQQSKSMPSTPVLESTPNTPDIGSSFALEPNPEANSTPARRINLYNGSNGTASHVKPRMGAGSGKQRRTVIVRSTEDLNVSVSIFFSILHFASLCSS